MLKDSGPLLVIVLGLILAVLLPMSSVLNNSGTETSFRPGSSVVVTCEQVPLQWFPEDEFLEPPSQTEQAAAGNLFWITNNPEEDWKQRVDIFHIYFLVEDGHGNLEGLLPQRCLEVVTDQ